MQVDLANALRYAEAGDLAVRRGEQGMHRMISLFSAQEAVGTKEVLTSDRQCIAICKLPLRNDFTHVLLLASRIETLCFCCQPEIS